MTVAIILAPYDGETQYLDVLSCQRQAYRAPVRWTAESMNTWVPTIQNQTVGQHGRS